ncbi:MAG: hypothetical protein IKP00_10430 [Victivallales bacterium]|nr:hypothetical protein [Victivallales bacterium]
MTLTAFILIVISAAMHVAWNTIAKKTHTSVPLYTLICTTAMLTWLHVQFWTPIHVLSLPTKFWLFTIGSVLSDAVLYCIGLTLSYARLEMSTAYPIMRALPILMTMLFTGLFGLGAPLSIFAKFGIVLVFIGCLHMPLKSYADFKFSNYLTISMLCVLMAALGTTGYTIFDSQAQKALKTAVEGMGFSKTTISVTYYSTRGICLSTTLWLMSLSTAHNRKIMADFFRKHDWHPLVAGACASATYMLVLLSMHYVTNVSYVQVFRQLGLPFGMLAGILILKEKCAAIKFIGCALIIAGLTLTVL